MTTENTAVVTETAVAASAEVVEQGVKGEIKSVLDGIAGIRKVKGLTAETVESSVAPLREKLKQLVEEFGQPVARGNTLYVVIAGELRGVDLTPGQLVRV